MEKKYNPKNIESKWYQYWEDHGYFTPSGQGQAYSIMIPPPNVTGSLHMGHAFQQAIMDALIRYHRMKGYNTLWQVGTDHAGIATQMVMERRLEQEENTTRHAIGRSAFLEKMWHWKDFSHGNITRQMRRLGNSVDWQSECFTMDENFSKAVKHVFIQLYREGLIYRGKRLVNWDIHLQSAVSDLEVENRDEKGKLWHIYYELEAGCTTQTGENGIVVATTRPETLLGDVAIAVHPDDQRYQHLIGKKVKVPIVNRWVTIIADEYADPNKGTGAVKITPAHDFNDYEVGKRHHLILLNIFNSQGAITEKAVAFDLQGRLKNIPNQSLPTDLVGLDRFEARKKILTLLVENNQLIKTEDHDMVIPYGDRSGVIIEPMLKDQWFVEAKPLAKPVLDAVKNGKIQFVPKQYENMFYAWMNDLQDWCISRQLWWGHRIPAWYDDQGSIFVGENEQAVRRVYNIDDSVTLQQDEDVLDTWFSSALWTFASLGWPDQTDRLATFHPTDVLVTGFDIIFFWVARMCMMTMHFLKDDNGDPQIPFKYVYITGLIRDEAGHKMSKSKGNVLDPIDMIDGIEIEELITKRTAHMMQPAKAKKIKNSTLALFPKGIGAHGADALRFTLYSLASTGRDINWDMNRLEGYRNFCNKIWNAANYIKFTIQENSLLLSEAELFNIECGLAERWILSQLQNITEKIHQNLQDFRFDHAATNLYDFVWNEYCAWYLEWNKTNSKQDHGDQLVIGQTVLLYVFKKILLLLHPMIPFLTEELWQQFQAIYRQDENLKSHSIMNQAYPTVEKKWIDQIADQQTLWLKSIITSVRNMRAQLKVEPSKMISVLIKNLSPEQQKLLKQEQHFVSALAKIKSIDFIDNNESSSIGHCMVSYIGEIEIYVPMLGSVDIEVEITRLKTDISRLEKDIIRIEKKLNNPDFIEKAPTTIVEKEQKKLAEYLKLKTASIEQLNHFMKR